jgi:hypothetical protein
MLTQIKSGARHWPAEGLTRVPYRVYQDEDLYRRELERIFLGPNWRFLCLEAELPDPGCFRTTSVGEMPVVVTRDVAVMGAARAAVDIPQPAEIRKRSIDRVLAETQ